MAGYYGAIVEREKEQVARKKYSSRDIRARNEISIFRSNSSPRSIFS